LVAIVALYHPVVNNYHPLPSATVTAYTCGYESTGKRIGEKGYCITAYGYHLTPKDSMKIVAADPRYYHSGQVIFLEDIGYVTVRDTGSAIKGKYRFDIFIDNLNEAKKFGVKELRMAKTDTK
jgi:3D (Asp-Asp-Asp) domain-containing protein